MTPAPHPTPEPITLASVRALYEARGADGLLALYESFFERLAASDELSTVFVTTPSHSAILLEEARSTLVSTPPSAPLYGVPFSVKDNIDVRDLPTYCGIDAKTNTTLSAPLGLAKKSASIVTQLQSLGAVLLGKTALDAFATGLTGTRAASGVVRSVYDPRYVGGGSSSGAGASVARACVALAIGTDTAGSGRVPAAMQGLAAVKPTRGTLSTAGVVPACRSLDTVAIMAATLRDAATVAELLRNDTTKCFAALARNDHWLRADRQVQRAAGQTPFVMYAPPHPDFEGDAKSVRCFDAALTLLYAIGATPIANSKEKEEDDLFAPLADAAALLYGGTFVAERYAAVGKTIEALPESSVDPTVRTTVLAARDLRAADAFADLDALRRHCARADAGLWAVADVLVVPTVPTVFTPEQVEREPVRCNAVLGRFTNFVNLMDLCAVAVPVDEKANEGEDGVPRGITLIAKAFHDDLLVDIAQRFVEAA